MWTKMWLGELKGSSLEEELRRRQEGVWREVGLPGELLLLLADLTQQQAGPLCFSVLSESLSSFPKGCLLSLAAEKGEVRREEGNMTGRCQRCGLLSLRSAS